MFGEGHFCLNVVFILTGLLAFVHQTECNGNSTRATEVNTFFFYQFPSYPRDCKEALDQCPSVRRDSSGVFLIKPDGYSFPFEVFCNNSFHTGGWTVIMRRIDGSLAFTRRWTEYINGFGFLGSEFWIGNKRLAFLTNQKRYQLRVDVTTSNGSTGFVEYSYFRVSDEWDNFKLANLGNAFGNIGDFITCQTNMIFTNCKCERTCEAPTVCETNCQVRSRCVCPDGFFLRDNECVLPTECICYSATAGKVIPVGESFINYQCSEQCSCSGDSLSCSNYSCDSRARCSRTNDGGRCDCNTGFVGNGLQCSCNPGFLADGSRCRRPRDCDEVPSVEGYSGSGLYIILPTNRSEFQVYCNMSEGRWTVFQRRKPGSSRSFKVSWNSYKEGFGILDEDFWLGNDKIHYLTSQRNYQLRIDMIDSGNRHYRAQYDGFRIENEGNKYRMTVLGPFSGNAGYDAMRHHLNQPFSTLGRDNDNHRYSCLGDHGACSDHGHCARLHEGGWWYRYRGAFYTQACDRYHKSGCNCHYSCAFSNLNGEENGSSGKTIFWHGLSGNDCGIKYTEMKIRPL